MMEDSSAKNIIKFLGFIAIVMAAFGGLPYITYLNGRDTVRFELEAYKEAELDSLFGLFESLVNNAETARRNLASLSDIYKLEDKLIKCREDLAATGQMQSKELKIAENTILHAQKLRESLKLMGIERTVLTLNQSEDVELSKKGIILHLETVSYRAANFVLNNKSLSLDVGYYYPFIIGDTEYKLWLKSCATRHSRSPAKATFVLIEGKISNMSIESIS